VTPAVADTSVFIAREAGRELGELPDHTSGDNEKVEL